MMHRRSPWLPLAAIHSLLLLRTRTSHSLSLPRERREFLAASTSFFLVAPAVTRRGLVTSITAATASCSAILLPLTSTPAIALSSKEAEVQYDEYASSYDDLDGGRWSRALGIDEARRRLTGLAMGRVLEIGVGTGLNLGFYDPAKVTSLTVVDVSDGMLMQAKLKARGLVNVRDIPFATYQADATTDLLRLFGEGSFDTVVDTFSLCVMGEDGARRCLDQMASVVKQKGGQVLLLENARSSNPLLGRYQDATAEAAAAAGGKGCVYNQDVSELIRSSGTLEIEHEEQYAAGLFRSYVCRPRIGK